MVDKITSPSGEENKKYCELYKKRHIDIFYNYVKYILFSESKLGEEKIRELMEPINAIYAFVKLKTFGKYRENLERELLHLRETAYIILNHFNLDNSENTNIDKIKISLLHDTREDNNTSFQTINETYGYKIALGVEAISKKNIFDFIDNNIDIKKLKKSGILNNYLSLNKEIKDKVSKKEKLSQDEINALKIFDNAKEKRKLEYFSRFKSFESMKKYIKSIAKKYKISNLNENDFDEITNNAFNVKFADRIHNLSTQWDPKNRKKVIEKIEETISYILPIAKQINIIAYNLMLEEIKKLIENFNNISELEEDIKNRVNKIILS